MFLIKKCECVNLNVEQIGYIINCCCSSGVVRVWREPVVQDTFGGTVHYHCQVLTIRLTVVAILFYFKPLHHSKKTAYMKLNAPVVSHAKEQMKYSKYW